MTVRSIRHPIKFHLVNLFGFMFLSGLGCVLAVLFCDLVEKKEAEPSMYFLLLLSAAIIFLACYTSWKYFKNAPSITIDNRTLTLRGQTFDLSEIKEITLTGKMPFKYLGTFPMEGFAIEFTSGQVEYLFNDLYWNTPELKSVLYKVANNKSSTKPQTKRSLIEKTQHSMPFTEYNGSHVLTFNGLMFYGWTIFIGVMVYIEPNTFLTILGAQISILLVTIMIWAAFSYQMHYFLSNDRCLYVYNSIWFWRQDKYEVHDLLEVVFETPYRVSTSMRVITTDFQEKLYPAGNLNSRKWRELKAHLTKAGVNVRMETVL